MVQISFFLQVIRNLHVSPGKFRGAETVHSLLEEKRQIRSIFPNGKHHRTATVVTQVKQMNMIIDRLRYSCIYHPLLESALSQARQFLNT